LLGRSLNPLAGVPEIRKGKEKILCFIIKEKNKEPIKAKKDIYVLKWTDEKITAKTFKSAYQYFRYTANKIYGRELGLWGNHIDTGFHSYYCGHNEKWFGVFKIPKGSTYYINTENGEIVSNQIVYMRPVKESEIGKSFNSFEYKYRK
jgi:hypothetical protein